MAFQVSPGVQISEIDLTNVVPAVSSTIGAFVGSFRWGPVGEVITVSDAKGLVDNFSSPANSTSAAEDFYTAESFLKYGSTLRIVRSGSTASLMRSANHSGDATSLLKNNEDYVNSYKSGALNGTVGQWVSRYPGVLGNSIKVSHCASASAYSSTSASTTSGIEAIGQTIIAVVSGAAFQVGDVITFAGQTQEYKVTGIASNDLTVKSLGQPANTGIVTEVASGTAINRKWEHHSLFNKAPGISSGAALAGATADEIHIVVIDEDGAFTGAAGTVLESFGFSSMASDAKTPEGSSLYYKDVIATQSKYVYWSGHNTATDLTAAEDRTLATSVADPFTGPTAPWAISLTGGVDGSISTAGQKHGDWTTHFGDAETIDISFLIVGSTRTWSGSAEQDTRADWTTLANQAILLAEARKDCMVILSPRYSDVVGVSSESTQSSNVKLTADTATSSSYAVIDSGWVYQYDRFHDTYRWVPANGHTAGIMARSDLTRDSWVSPAGFSRGQYLGITKLAFNPKQASRDDLYRARVNPVVTFPGQGTLLYGDKTALSSPSAFDRINVRRLFIVLEKAIAVAAKAQLFEFNDAFTRAQFRSAIEPFLRDVKNRRGLVDYSVICDDTNNTDSVIDRNEFVCSIFVKPARSINFITLNFVAARSGVEFSEIYSAV
jgi:phage tail sheath protein FI|tara:strand:+ start:2554 stop:4545 length:1992 start_codon:yes stop_codon:yes gene_type:complete